MSLGSSGATDGTDPMSQALNDLSRRTGTLFVVAAGNEGEQVPARSARPGPRTPHSPSGPSTGTIPSPRSPAAARASVTTR